MLVRALADRWGIERSPAGKIVWAELQDGRHRAGCDD
jgi:hypothetical protein